MQVTARSHLRLVHSAPPRASSDLDAATGILTAFALSFPIWCVIGVLSFWAISGGHRP
jgi:hypothetical protein